MRVVLKVMRVIDTATKHPQSSYSATTTMSSRNNNDDGTMVEPQAAGRTSPRRRKRDTNDNVEDEKEKERSSKRKTSENNKLSENDEPHDNEAAVMEAVEAAAVAEVAADESYNTGEVVETAEVVVETEAAGNGKKSKDGGWMHFYNRLVEYKRQKGNTEVPQRYKEDPSLGSWCKNQREYYKNYTNNKTSSLTEERIALLNKIDFAWISTKTKRRVMKDFDVHLAELQHFKELHGHTRVPHVFDENPGLGVFCHRVKIYHREIQEGKRKSPNDWLTPERIEALNQLEFEWKVGRWKNALTWEERFEQLEEFHKQNGHTRVTKEYDEKHAPGLKAWVGNQRTYLMRAHTKEKRVKKAVTLSKEKIASLKSLGVTFEKVESTAEPEDEAVVEGVMV